nr:MAG TPA: hypothetical protein [Caudoviricetes sp.]
MRPPFRLLPQLDRIMTQKSLKPVKKKREKKV